MVPGDAQLGTGDGTARAPFDRARSGVWTGETSQNLPLTFAVLQDGTLAGFRAEVLMQLGTDACRAPLTTPATQSLSGDELSVLVRYPLGTPNTTFRGEFDGARHVSGTFDRLGAEDGYSLQCGDVFIEGYGSGVLFEEGTWQASLCETCSDACESENDGHCDEPEGFGLCFEGQDPADCCSHPRDGQCEEAGMGGTCGDGRDFYDCGYCRFANDGTCDEPRFCPMGTDEADCGAGGGGGAGGAG